MASSLTVALSLMPAPRQGGFDFSVLYGGSAAGGGGRVFNPGNVHVALAQAEANEAKQLEQARETPVTQRELERYEKVVTEAETLDDVLDDPIARRVLLTAFGLGDQADYVGLAKKALSSNPADPDSLANKLANINGAWLEFAKKYDVHQFGLSKLRAEMDGFAGKWAVTLDRDGAPADGVLEIKNTEKGWEALLDGAPTPIEVKDGKISINVLWEDKDENLRVTLLDGKLTADGMSGAQTESAKNSGSWSARPFYANAIAEVQDFYVGEKRLDTLDEQLPGLGTAILFKRSAASFDNVTKILGSALGREVVTTALGLPKEIALQSLVAQEKAINQRLDVSKLQNPEFVDRLVQRYLLQLNGGQSGVTA